jgi:acyl-CoA thioester hydrolase
MTVGHSIPVRVYFEDTDAEGVVYYANYLRFMERARTEWLRAIGYEIDRLAADGIVFAVRSACIEYVRPARLDDLLTVSATLEKAGRVSMDVAHEITRGGDIVCRGAVRLACLQRETFAPRRIPETLLTVIAP